MKAKLILDMPKYCRECKFIYQNQYYNIKQCMVTDKLIESDMPTWCPFEPIILDFNGIEVVPHVTREQSKKACELATQILNYYADHPDEIKKIIESIGEK